MHLSYWRACMELSEVLTEVAKIPVSHPTGLPVGTRIRIKKTKESKLNGAVGYLLPYDSTAVHCIGRLKLESGKGVVSLTRQDVWDVLSTPLDGHLEPEPVL